VVKNIIKKILTGIPIILGVVTLIFFLLRMTGTSPVSVIAGEDASFEIIEMLNARYGFDQPIYVQWWRYITMLFRGDFGNSILTGRAIFPDLMFNFRFTLQMILASTFVSLTLGIPFGILTAIKRNSWIDHVVRIVSLLGASMPAFWVALLALRFFSVDLGWFPVMGIGTGFWNTLWHLVLPATTLGFALMALIARMTRTAMLEVMGEQYMSTAKAKGLTYFKQVMKHAFKNATIPVVTVIGLQMGRLLSVGMVIETVFFRPGLGTFLFTGITNMDFPTIQGTVIFCSLVLILINILVDIAYSLLDPRISY